MSDEFNFNRIEEETCSFCKASPFVDCAIDCPVNYAEFGQTIPDSLRGVITMELLKQAEWIYEKKQADWMDKMLIERVENVMNDWPMFISFIEVLSPPPLVPGFTVTFSLNTFPLPIDKKDFSPEYFKS